MRCTIPHHTPRLRVLPVTKDICEYRSIPLQEQLAAILIERENEPQSIMSLASKISIEREHELQEGMRLHASPGNLQEGTRLHANPGNPGYRTFDAGDKVTFDNHMYSSVPHAMAV
jgi:hypothetical protein